MFFGAGAVAAYFLDPEAGPTRRDRVMQQVRSLSGEQSSDEGPLHGDDASSDAPSERPRASTGAVDLATGATFSSG